MSFMAGRGGGGGSLCSTLMLSTGNNELVTEVGSFCLLSRASIFDLIL